MLIGPRADYTVLLEVGMGRVWAVLGLALLMGCSGSKPSDTEGSVQDTDTVADADADGDGWPASEDCDDANVDVHPGRLELCDGIDNNCDGETDEGVETTFYADNDGDGYGDAEATASACSAPSGYVPTATDCDDDAETVYPGSPELCDGLDNDCDTIIDEDASSGSTWYDDDDGDGYGDPNDASTACAQPANTVANAADCDDSAASAFPGGEELCDGLDNDCDGETDEAFVSDDLDGGLPADLTLNGDATWTSEDGDGFVRLTAISDGDGTLYDQAGSAMFSLGVPGDRWKVSFSASIHDGAGVTRPDGRTGSGGDGMALVLLDGEDDGFLGQGGEYLGYYDATAAGYALELDTYCNADYGTSDCYYIYSDYNDPSGNHMSLVDVSTMEHLASNTEIPTLEDGGEMAVTVSYLYGTLTATLSNGSAAWTLTETLAWPDGDAVQLGFTAGTGWEINDHDIDDVVLGCP